MGATDRELTLMMLLTRRFLWQLLDWRGLLFPAVLFLAAAQLSSNHTLGTQSLGDYLALASLAPIWLIYRACDLSHQRLHAQGWADEEVLRSPTKRLPLSEFLAACLALLLLLTLAGAAKSISTPTSTDSPQLSYRALPFQPTDEGHLLRAQTWPNGSQLFLTLHWANLPDPAATISHPDFGSLRPGEMLKINPKLIPANDDGYWVFDFHKIGLSDDQSAPKLATDMSRMAIPRPKGPLVLPLSLLRMAAFFLPLLAAALALVRHTSIRPLLATASTLIFGWMTTWPALDSPASASPIARFVWSASQALPDLSGLLTLGHDWELQYGTTPLSDLLLWLIVFGGIGLVSLLQPRRRPKS